MNDIPFFPEPHAENYWTPAMPVEKFWAGLLAGTILVSGRTFAEIIAGNRRAVAEARRENAADLDRFAKQVIEYWAYKPVPTTFVPRRGLAPETGVGKSTGAIRMAAGLKADGFLGEDTIVHAVPDHALAGEIVALYRKQGLRATVWRGREAEDPDRKDAAMCLNLEAVAEVIKGGHKVEENCCIRNRGEHKCPFYDECGYQKQKSEAKSADAIVVPHASLFNEKPSAIGSPGLLVIDERFYDAGINQELRLPLDQLDPSAIECKDPRVTGGFQRDEEAGAKLGRAHEKLLRAVIGTEAHKPVGLETLRREGLTPALCREAAALSYRRYRDPALRPGMEPAEIKDRIADARGRVWLLEDQAATLWEALGEALANERDAGDVTIGISDKNGVERRVLRVRRRREIAKGWLATTKERPGPDGEPVDIPFAIPVLHLDATLRPELVRPFIPAMTFAPPIRVASPHVTVRQYLRAPQSKKALGVDPKAEPEETKKSLLELHRFILGAARRAKGKALDGIDMLVIAQKDVEEALGKLGLPEGVETAHFGKLVGQDRWKGVRRLIVIGRTQPRSAETESMAAAFDGVHREPVDPHEFYAFPQGAGLMTLTGGRCVEAKSVFHPDALTNALRASITEDQLEQAIGRARGVNRTAETPLDVDLIVDVPLPIPVARIERWRRDVIMLAAEGVLLESPADMALCFPHLWKTAKAAERDKAKYRDTSVSGIIPPNPLYSSHKGMGGMIEGWAVIEYQKPGPKQQWRKAYFDTAMVSDPNQWLTERLKSEFSVRPIGG